MPIREHKTEVSSYGASCDACGFHYGRGSHTADGTFPFSVRKDTFIGLHEKGWLTFKEIFICPNCARAEETK